MSLEYIPFDLSGSLPRFIRSPKNKDEQFLWEGIFREDTANYILTGSGNYRHVTGEYPEFYVSGDTVDNHVLEAVVLIHGVNKKLICGGKITTWDKEKFKDSKNPMHDYLFCMEDGKVARTDFEKEKVIQKHIKKLSE